MSDQTNDPKEGNGKQEPIINTPEEVTNAPEKITNDPEEIISSPDEVQESNDEKIDQDYPGYPHYPAKDDIFDPDKNEN